MSIPFGKADCTVFRKVMSAEDTIQEFASALRAGAGEGAADGPADARRPVRLRD